MATVEQTFTLRNKVGLHARPAGLLVQTAARFVAATQVACNGRVADAKRILQVLQLGAEYGAELHVTAVGVDAAEALAAIGALIVGRFGEAE